MILANPLLEVEEAKKIVDRFVRRFDESYRLLIYHAAIPLILTPELLNYLRHQFLRGQVPWVAEVDLLLSDLFNPVGYELYAMDTAVRAYLLSNIKEFFQKQGLDEKHLQEVALVLLGYIKYLARTNSFGTSELQAQQWAAMVCLEDKKEDIFREIKQAFQNCINEAELARLTQITQELSPQLSNYPSLIQFAESMRDLLLEISLDLTKTRQTITQLSQDLEIDLSKFPQLGIEKQSIGLNHILLVEDRQQVIERISKSLSEYGITVRGTDDVNEVIKLAESGNIDLILINYGLPHSYYQDEKVDGLTIVQILKTNPDTSSLPIVGFSSYPVIANEFLESGADGFYSKKELFESNNYQKFVDYLQEIFHRVTLGKSLQVFEFKTVFVNKKGETINTQAGKAYYYDEPLREGVEPLRMIAIPEGEFLMGSPTDEKGRYDRESPQHEVKVSEFFISQTPITQAQWQVIARLPQIARELKINPFRFTGKNNPVDSISWSDAIEFCARLSHHTGRNYRLPSEAEWEYACRGGTTTPFHFGETITSELANYNGTYTYAEEPEDKYRQKTTPVRTFPPNPFGLYDMHGNVWEWCLDTWHNNYENAPSDARVWDEQNNNDNRYQNVAKNIEELLTNKQGRVNRGGSWVNLPSLCRCAYRDYLNADFDDNVNIGFRVVLGLPRTE